MALAALASGWSQPGFAQAASKIKVGLMLPYSGNFAAAGEATTNGFKLAMAETNGKLGGREVEFYTVDDESNPAKSAENISKLIKRDQVDVVVGTIHSGVTLVMAKIARDTNTLLLIPNAGADELTGPLCAPNVFRMSATNWQPSFAMGKVMAERGHRKVVTLTWKYAAGEESVAGFKEAFEKSGGKVEKELYMPFPNVEFYPYLTEIARIKPDAVFVFFAGGGGAKFLNDYNASGLKATVPLYGSGFLTEGNLESQGAAAQGVHTALHYTDGLTTARDVAFRKAYRAAYGKDPDVYALQGYDTGLALRNGVEAVKGDLKQRAVLVNAMNSATVDSPRGPFKFSTAHNPTQDIYLRVVEGKINKVAGIAAKGLADPARGCKLK
ncbi:MAG: ABC transporter substrate-binding protein [Pseudomonadota bacterium]